MLKKVYIDGYKSLVDFTFEPAHIQLILGENGSGKSTFFEAMDRLRAFISDGLKVSFAFGSKSLTRWAPTSDQRFELTVEGNGGIYEYYLIIHHAGPPYAPVVAYETLNFNGSPLFSFEDSQATLPYDDREKGPAKYPLDDSRSGLFNVPPSSAYDCLSWFKKWVDRLICHRGDPWILPPGDKTVTKPDINMTDFAAWFRQFQPDDLEALTSPIIGLKNGVIDGFERMFLEGSSLSSEELFVEFHRDPDSVSGVEGLTRYRIDELSDGQRVLIKLVALTTCLLKRGSTLLLDDPTVHVGLREVQPWIVTLLDRVDDIDAQAIVISHHPEIVNYMGRGDVAIFRRDGDGPVIAKPTRFDDPKDLPPAELAARGWIDA